MLLVDDILDEGYTLRAIRDFCLDQGAARVLDRRAVREAPRRAACPASPRTSVGVEVPDRYVFGYGMDYHEQGRNLPAIYAVDA